MDKTSRAFHLTDLIIFWHRYTGQQHIESLSHSRFHVAPYTWQKHVGNSGPESGLGYTVPSV